ncbi:Group 3 truncated hemoglobin ctb [Candidatus Ornithobacterium hominis]|uniref:group III truncated hemoglobin n=1 Tax=Candidatus Ornithobacterium hominis TaxID=2497989 RepID=UPI0024BCFB22|nr:group III truncated hemoglobin [Candidatus Ornithobacterium hominis]CAI9428593.1 Group 3 truncated hemoglobin ctb [Candidatus Ornithobacterium hominis]
MKDIQDIEDVKQMVDSFYGKIRKDELLGPIFNGLIQDRWAEHLEKMYAFWETVLLDNHSYYGSPFAPHATMDVQKHHFERWVEIFNANMDSLFAGEIADEAKWRAAKMAEMFNYKIQYIRENRL